MQRIRLTTNVKKNALTRAKDGRVLKEHQRRLASLWKSCARAFVVAAVSKISVQTGMSVNSLEPLSRKLGRVGASFPIGKPRLTRMSLQGKTMPKQYKSARLGKAAGERAFEFDDSKVRMSFAFKIRVWQWWYHEHYGQQWGAMDAARTAFWETYYQNIYKTDPDIVKYITTGEFNKETIYGDYHNLT